MRAARSHIRVNCRLWESTSAQYERRHRKVLSGAKAMSWGLWRRPESELRLLPAVRGQDILELGCGAARWSIALAGLGARAVGVDLSRAQLGVARELVRTAGARVALVHGSAERLPFHDAQFDLIFCDWGALTFADPERAIPESARLLRTGGHLVFCTATPISILFRDRAEDRLRRHLTVPYFGMHRVDYGDEIDFQLPYGEWIRLFRESGFEVERLEETRPRPSERSTYLTREEEAWARRWPMEAIWRLRRVSGARTARARPRSRAR